MGCADRMDASKAGEGGEEPDHAGSSSHCKRSQRSNEGKGERLGLVKISVLTRLATCCRSCTQGPFDGLHVFVVLRADYFGPELVK